MLEDNLQKISSYVFRQLSTIFNERPHLPQEQQILLSTSDYRGMIPHIQDLLTKTKQKYSSSCFSSLMEQMNSSSYLKILDDSKSTEQTPQTHRLRMIPPTKQKLAVLKRVKEQLEALPLRSSNNLAQSYFQLFLSIQRVYKFDFQGYENASNLQQIEEFLYSFWVFTAVTIFLKKKQLERIKSQEDQNFLDFRVDLPIELMKIKILQTSFKRLTLQIKCLPQRQNSRFYIIGCLLQSLIVHQKYLLLVCNAMSHALLIHRDNIPEHNNPLLFYAQIFLQRVQKIYSTVEESGEEADQTIEFQVCQKEWNCFPLINISITKSSNPAKSINSEPIVSNIASIQNQLPNDHHQDRGSQSFFQQIDSEQQITFQVKIQEDINSKRLYVPQEKLISSLKPIQRAFMQAEFQLAEQKIKQLVNSIDCLSNEVVAIKDFGIFYVFDCKNPVSSAFTEYHRISSIKGSMLKFKHNMIPSEGAMAGNRYSVIKLYVISPTQVTFFENPPSQPNFEISQIFKAMTSAFRAKRHEFLLYEQLFKIEKGQLKDTFQRLMLSSQQSKDRNMQTRRQTERVVQASGQNIFKEVGQYFVYLFFKKVIDESLVVENKPIEQLITEIVAILTYNNLLPEVDDKSQIAFLQEYINRINNHIKSMAGFGIQFKQCEQITEEIARIRAKNALHEQDFNYLFAQLKRLQGHISSQLLLTMSPTIFMQTTINAIKSQKKTNLERRKSFIYQQHVLCELFNNRTSIKKKYEIVKLPINFLCIELIDKILDQSFNQPSGRESTESKLLKYVYQDIAAQTRKTLSISSEDSDKCQEIDKDLNDKERKYKTLQQQILDELKGQILTLQEVTSPHHSLSLLLNKVRCPTSCESCAARMTKQSCAEKLLSAIDLLKEFSIIQSQNHLCNKNIIKTYKYIIKSLYPALNQ